MKIVKTKDQELAAFYVIGSIIMSLIVCIIAFSCSLSHASDEESSIHCIMGEARGQEYKEIVAHAEAFRNREKRYGRVWGVDGCKAKFNEPKWVHERVKKAWKESEYTNYTQGADHWHADYITPYWVKGANMTAHIGKTKFYKGVK